MPALEWNRDLRAFTKTCSKCKTVFIGAEDQDEAEKILLDHFQLYWKASDGFFSQCKGCRNGEKGGYQLPTSREKMLEAQAGKCAICSTKISFTPKNDERAAVVDHMHSTGVVRRLLCTRCNIGMSYVDDHRWLTNAVKYRRYHDYTRFRK